MKRQIKNEDGKGKDPNRVVTFRVTASFPMDFGDGRAYDGTVTFSGGSACLVERTLDKDGSTMGDTLHDAFLAYLVILTVGDNLDLWAVPRDCGDGRELLERVGAIPINLTKLSMGKL